MALKEKHVPVVQRASLLLEKVERLRHVRERYPASLWAKRAGLVSGVLLIEREPAVALEFLRAAQRDFPVLDEYVRLWMGEALLRSGDATVAARMFESIPQVAPESNLTTRAAYRTGEGWYQAHVCPEAIEWLTRALAMGEKEPSAPTALLRLGECQKQHNLATEAQTTFKQLWLRYPYAPEAKDAQNQLTAGFGGERWAPTADDYYTRAQAFLGQALHAEAVEELRRFQSAAPQHPKRFEGKFKLGVSHVRLKQYDQARDTFRQLAADQVHESLEASVWLARVYLRLGAGDKLLDLAKSMSRSSLSGDQQAQVQVFAGIWREDQGQFDQAIERYREAARVAQGLNLRVEALWRIGWVYYRTGRFREAADTFTTVVEQHESDFEPQGLYWLARTLEREQPDKAKELYNQLCKKVPFGYYCQLAAKRTDVGRSGNSTNGAADDQPPVVLPLNRHEVERQPAYRRAIELKTLGLDPDAARELASLTERYGRDPDVLLALSSLLNDVGAYAHALRLARAHFRDKLERGGAPVPPVLWAVAYPTGLLPLIQSQGVKDVDPYLAAAIIREESQYDERAVSRVGAVGLMQLMTGTANAVAQRYGYPVVGREELFDQETNIRLGVRYLQQLLDQFSGNPIHAIAAYNAGPIAVSSWVATQKGRDPDEFVELIPYLETRQYVKRVLRSYREYLRLAQPSTDTVS
jgi:soluble lytic murein transglycosylase